MTSTAVSTLWELYRVASPIQRSPAALRPYICPVAPLINSVPAGATVMDIGCGNGLTLALMTRLRIITHGVGIERSPRALETARKISEHANLRLTFVEASTPDSWPDELFDAVTMIDVLHHVPKTLREDFVSRALERVKDNGRFIYKDMASKPWWRVAWNGFHDLVLARQLVRMEPVANVLTWARNQGFYPMSTESYVACGVYGHELVVFTRKS